MKKTNIRLQQELIESLKSLASPAIIAISGFGGSGKSTLANYLGGVLDASVVSIDSFMKPGAFTTEYSHWEIMDFHRLEKEVLKPFLNKDNRVAYGHFNPKLNKITETKMIGSHETIIVEGVGIFRPQLTKYFAYKIWIDCPIEIAIQRGKKRDREEYGSPTDALWDGLWKKNDLEFNELFKPQESANYIVDGKRDIQRN